MTLTNTNALALVKGVAASDNESPFGKALNIVLKSHCCRTGPRQRSFTSGIVAMADTLGVDGYKQLVALLAESDMCPAPQAIVNNPTMENCKGADTTADTTFSLCCWCWDTALQNWKRGQHGW